MIISLDKNNKQFDRPCQKIVIVKELQKIIGEVYLGGGGTITTDGFFIIVNVRIDFQIDAADF